MAEADLPVTDPYVPPLDLSAIPSTSAMANADLPATDPYVPPLDRSAIQSTSALEPETDVDGIATVSFASRLTQLAAVPSTSASASNLADIPSAVVISVQDIDPPASNDCDDCGDIEVEFINVFEDQAPSSIGHPDNSVITAPLTANVITAELPGDAWTALLDDIFRPSSTSAPKTIWPPRATPSKKVASQDPHHRPNNPEQTGCCRGQGQEGRREREKAEEKRSS